MDDEPKASEKPEAVDEPLIKFVPGEDMIAAHKRAMRARAEPSAPPGFFSDPAIAATSATPQPAPKVFNPADYLLPEKDGAGRVEEVEKSSGGSSRFQRFFGGAQASERSSAPAAPQANVLHAPSPVPTSSSRKDDSAMKLDDHMAKLLGMLDVKVSSPALPYWMVADVHRLRHPFHCRAHLLPSLHEAMYRPFHRTNSSQPAMAHITSLRVCRLSHAINLRPFLRTYTATTLVLPTSHTTRPLARHQTFLKTLRRSNPGFTPVCPSNLRKVGSCSSSSSCSSWLAQNPTLTIVLI